MRIDPTRPLRIKGDSRRKVHTVGFVQNNPNARRRFMIAVQWGEGSGWNQPIELDPETGRVPRGQTEGSALEFENVPEVTSGFYPLSPRRGGPYGRGMTMLEGALADYPDAIAILEIIYEDDKPKEAKIHAVA
jgi:hypothetical protein